MADVAFHQHDILATKLDALTHVIRSPKVCARAATVRDISARVFRSVADSIALLVPRWAMLWWAPSKP